MFSFSAYFASVEQNQPELGTRQHRRDNETMLHTKTFLLIALHAWLYSFWLLHLNTKAHLSTFCSSLKAITYCHVDVVAKLRNCRIPSSGISSCICACWVLACYNFLAGGCRWQHGQSGSLHTYSITAACVALKQLVIDTATASRQGDDHIVPELGINSLVFVRIAL